MARQSEKSTNKSKTSDNRLDLCVQYWSPEGCHLSSGCGTIHICKLFVFGLCHTDGCSYGHSIKSTYNTPILAKLNLAQAKPDKLLKHCRNAQVFKGLIEQEVPSICVFHNKSLTCKYGEDGDGCPFMHICSRFVKDNSCKFADSECRYSHDILKPQVKTVLLVNGYFNISKKNELKILKKLRAKFSSEKEKAPSSKQVKPSTDRSQSSSGEGGLPIICTFHNNDLRCKSGRDGVGCSFMHICACYVKDDSCKFANSQCRYSHDILKPQVKSILMIHGYDVNSRTVPDVLNTLRRKFSGQERSRQNSSPTPNWCDSDEYESEGDDDDDDDDDEPEICTFHLLSKCKFGPKCDLLHCDMPYEWQYEEERDRWTPFSQQNNQRIEQAFCDHNNATIRVRLLDSRNSPTVKIDFTQMSYAGHGRGDVRRCSTMSRGETSKNRPFVTQWLWYWLDEHGAWNLYPDSDEIEEHFCDGEDDHQFKSGRHNYILNFDDMKQKNKRYGTERDVRRRPKFYQRPPPAQQGLKQVQSAALLPSAHLPSTWDMSGTSETTHVKTVPLDKTSSEFQEIKKLFRKTMSPHGIKSIQRIQNTELWQEFIGMKLKMLRRDGAASAASAARLPSRDEDLCAALNEKLLFHGTRKDLIEPIYTQRGFDWRLAGSSVGTLYGKGNYFARDANYSSSYTDCKTLFVVRVLIGQYTEGSRDLVKPPPRDATKPYGDTYDTCVDNVKDPSIFVTFEFGQSYPAYLLKYK